MTSLRIGWNIFFSQLSGEVAQALPSLRVISIEDEETGSTFLVKKICAQGDLTPQVIKQVADVRWFVDADVAAVIKLAGVKVSTLDESLGQRQGWPRELWVWKHQAFALDHRVNSIAHPGSARQAAQQAARSLWPSSRPSPGDSNLTSP